MMIIFCNIQQCKSENSLKPLHLFLFILIMLLLPMILVFANDPLLNILQNGDFDRNLEQWSHWTDASAAVTFQTEGKKAKPIVGKKVAYIKISKAGNADWHIQLYQQPFALTKGKTYTFSLWAKSEKPRTITMRILHQGAPWNEYVRMKINLTAEWQLFFVTFKMPADDPNSRAGVIMGGEKADVWLDHIRLYEGEFVDDLQNGKLRAVEAKHKLTTNWGKIKTQSSGKLIEQSWRWHHFR